MAKSKNRRHETTRFPVPNGRPSDPKSPKVTPKPLRFPLREEGGIAKWKCMSLTVVYQRFRERTFALFTEESSASLGFHLPLSDLIIRLVWLRSQIELARGQPPPRAAGGIERD